MVTTVVFFSLQISGRKEGGGMDFDYFYNREAEGFNFLKVPEILVEGEEFQGLSAEAILLYAMLLKRAGMSYKNNWLDKQNRVFIYFTVEEIMRKRHLSKPTAIKLLDELDKILGNNIFLSFSTNGIGINSETINVLKKYSVNMYKVNISCDSIIEVNNALNRGDNSYANAITALCLLNSIKDIHLTLFSVIIEYTKRDIILTYAFLKELKIKNYGITIALKKGSATEADIIDATDIVDGLYTIMKDSENNHVIEVYANQGYSSHEDCKSKIQNGSLIEKEQNIYFREKCDSCIS